MENIRLLVKELVDKAMKDARWRMATETMSESMLTTPMAIAAHGETVKARLEATKERRMAEDLLTTAIEKALQSAQHGGGEWPK